MKIRNGWVSNSSSSSFVINIKDLTYEQIFYIKHHHNTDSCYEDEAWDITETDTTIAGHTPMDNFDMAEYLNALYINNSVVKWF